MGISSRVITSTITEQTTLTEKPAVRSKDESQLVQKFDTWLLPTLILMCLFQAVDKTLIGVAKIDGIENDLRLTQHQFNIAIMIFQLGYLLLQIPSNLLLTRIRPSIYLPICCIAWSTVAAGHVLVRDYTGLLTVRVLLGICDAPYWVAAIHVLSSWYTKRELVMRASVLFASIIIAFVAISPICAGLMEKLEGRWDWSGWRWLYLIFGLCGFAPAIIGLFTLPDYPESHSRRFWMSEAEQMMARDRMKQDRVNESQFKQQQLWSGLRDALKDLRTWIFVIMFMSRNTTGGLFYYLPDIVKSFDLFPRSSLSRNTVALLLDSPPALLAAALAMFLAYTSNRYQERTYHIVIPLVLAAITLIVSAATMDTVARYISIYFYLAGSISSSGLAWSWVPNAIQDSPEKKACAIAIVNVFGGLGSVWAPFLFRKQDYPGYHPAFIVMAVFTALDIGCCFLLRYVLRKQNEKMQQNARNSETTLSNEDMRSHVV